MPNVAYLRLIGAPQDTRDAEISTFLKPLVCNPGDHIEEVVPKVVDGQRVYFVKMIYHNDRSQLPDLIERQAFKGRATLVTSILTESDYMAKLGRQFERPQRAPMLFEIPGMSVPFNPRDQKQPRRPV